MKRSSQVCLAGLMIALALSFGASPLAAQSETTAHQSLRAGDEAFRKKDFAGAELHYRRAEEREPSFQTAYNLGVTLGYLARAEEAAPFFELARERARESEDRGDASYNAGTARLDEKELQASVKDYAQALQANPKDDEARQNLSHALRQLRRQEQQQQQQQSQQDSDQKQPQEPQEEDQQQQDRQQQEEDQRDSEEQSPQQPSPQQPQPEQNQPQGNDEGESDGEQPEQTDEPTEAQGGKAKRPLPAEEAERLLQIAADQEKRTNEKMRFGESQVYKPAKDW